MKLETRIGYKIHNVLLQSALMVQPNYDINRCMVAGESYRYQMEIKYTISAYLYRILNAAACRSYVSYVSTGTEDIVLPIK